MSEPNQGLEQFLTELTLRMVAHRWKELDAVWECANRICDRYEAEQDRLSANGRGSAQLSRTLP